MLNAGDKNEKGRTIGRCEGWAHVQKFEKIVQSRSPRDGDSWAKTWQ